MCKLNLCWCLLFFFVSFQIDFGIGFYIKFWGHADTDHNFKLTRAEYKKARQNEQWKKIADEWEDHDKKKMEDWFLDDEIEFEDFFKKVRKGI